MVTQTMSDISVLYCNTSQHAVTIWLAHNSWDPLPQVTINWFDTTTGYLIAFNGPAMAEQWDPDCYDANKTWSKILDIMLSGRRGNPSFSLLVGIENKIRKKKKLGRDKALLPSCATGVEMTKKPPPAQCCMRGRVVPQTGSKTQRSNLWMWVR